LGTNLYSFTYHPFNDIVMEQAIDNPNISLAGSYLDPYPKVAEARSYVTQRFVQSGNVPTEQCSKHVTHMLNVLSISQGHVE